MQEQRRDGEWFTAEIAVNLDAVFRYFVRRAPRQDADDLTADVFATAWRRRDSIAEGAELAWLYRTAGFVLANYRRRTRESSLEDAPAVMTQDHTERVAAADELSRALAQLRPRERDVLLLHAWEGLDGTELADALGMSRSGAQSALSRARAHLRTLWSEGSSDPAAEDRLQDSGSA